MVCKKKLYLPFPRNETLHIETQRTKTKTRVEPSDEKSIERHVRQLLCNKIIGNLVGVWLLIPEHLRLGTWDLLLRWTNKSSGRVEPRLALQLVHEAALCTTGKRKKRTLSQQGFEVANGLPFVGSDNSIHELLNAHTVCDAHVVQMMLGKFRKALGHYPGTVLAMDPHRIQSYSKRQMVRRKKSPSSPAMKQIQTFFIFDADSQQPICFTIGSSSKTVTSASIALLDLSAQILCPQQCKPLVLSDNEHYSFDLLHYVAHQSPFDLLVPMTKNKRLLKEFKTVDPESFTHHWVGYATTMQPFYPKSKKEKPYWQIIERLGESENDYQMNAFLCTSHEAAVQDPIQQFPKRWHCEEFFNENQALGWDRAGTLNLNIRYGSMTMALIAQTAIYMMKKRVGDPIVQWDAQHLANDFFHGLEGDVKLREDTIIVTYYNAPNEKLLKDNYENLPEKLKREGINPKIPWLYDYKLDFRFK